MGEVVKGSSASRLREADYRALLELETTRLGGVEIGDLDAEIPHLPGWTVHSVVGHTAWVCRYVTQSLQATPQDPPSRSSVGEPPVGPDVLMWYAEATQALREEVATVDLAQIRPTWTGPQPGDWWLRRLSHELAVHRWDVAAATSTDPDGPEPIDAALALDGVDEVLEVFVPNRMQFDTLAGSGETIHLHATDIEHGEWLLQLGPHAVSWEHRHAKGDVAVRAAASDLQLLLWGRIPPDRLEVFGDQMILSRWQAAAAF